MEEEIKQATRIVYCEPSKAMDGSDEQIVHPYDEYSMAVDLTIEVHNRFSCGFGKETGEIETFNYSTENGTISFLGGSKEDDGNFLTINYTDISMTNPEKNTSECLGIESITINYDSWFYPQVNIKFVDVRGATVFQQSEKEYYGEGGYGGSRTIYKSLFSFPYPIFTLRVKGFYGKGVTYKLAVSKTNMSFDSASGNFIITVDFIGYMYGIFADIPMTFLAIAPYTRNGVGYWQEKKADGTFTFKSKTGESCEMPTFPELRKKMFEALSNQEVVENRKRYEDGVGKKTEQLNAIRQILEQEWPFSDEWKHFENEKFIDKDTGKEISNNLNWYLVVSSLDMAKGFGEKLAQYKTLVEQYDSTYGTKYCEMLELELNYGLATKTNSGETQNITACNVLYQYLKNANPPHYQAFVLPNISTTINTSGQTTSEFNGDYRYNLIAKYGGLEGKLLSESGNSKVDKYVIIYSKTGESLDTVKKKIRDDLSKVELEIEKQNKECEQIENQLIEAALGFKPSIKNIYELAFAHMDTFMHVFYGYMREIKNQLDGDRELRNKSHYLLDTGGWETDTENEIAASGNENNDNKRVERSHYLPPFTAFYQSTNETSGEEGNDERVTLKWPGLLTNSQDLVEVGFVYDFLESAGLYFKIAYEVEKTIEEANNNAAETQGLNTGDLKVGVENFIPATTYDLVNNTGDYNPYSYLKEKIDDDSEKIESDVFFTFLSRLYYFSLKHRSISACKSFGTIEGINFYKANGDKASGNFLNFIKDFAGEEKKYELAEKILKCATDSNCSDEICGSWKDIGTGKLFSTECIDTGNGTYGYKYNLFNTETIQNKEIGAGFPIGEFNPTNVKRDFASGEDFIKNENYLFNSSKTGEVLYRDGEYGEFKTGRTLESGTFTVIEDGTYTQKIAENAISEMEVSLGKFTENEEVLRETKDTYGEVYEQNDVFKNIQNLVLVEDECVYRKTSVVDATGERISRGKLKELVTGDDKEKQETFYIKYPSVYGGDSSLIYENGMYRRADDYSVFDTNLYKQQSNILCKAYLYVQSIPLLATNDVDGLQEKNEDGTSMKSRLLREGAFYWYEKEGYDSPEFNTTGYKKAEKDEWYVNGGTMFYDRTYETISPIMSTDETNTYRKWKEPENCTESRKNYLIEYFKNWAYSSYKNIEPYLYDSSYYNSKNKGSKYEGGLNLDCITGSTTEKTDGAIKIQKFLRDLFFTECTVFDYGTNNNYYLRRDFLIEGLVNFLKQLELEYNSLITDIKESPSDLYSKIASMERDDPFKNDDLRLSTYMTLKSLYDKWLCAPYHGIDTWSLGNSEREANFYDDKTYYKSDFDNFFYIDNYYHDISYDINVNLTKVSEWISKCLPTTEEHSIEGIMGYFNKTLYEYMAEIAQDCGGMLLALPQRFGLVSGAIGDMFKPIPACGNWADDSSSFVFVYTYRPSERLGEVNSNIDMNGWSPQGDGFDLLDANITNKIMGGNGYTIPAFGVTFAKQNQSYFKNITLNSETQGTTEVGLRATFNIASKASTQPRETLIYGQDLYKVFSNYSYECTVEMLGDMQVFPLMYFQLNNIPLWRGAYMIKKVVHNITAGNITTTFTGIRQNRYSVPFANGNLTVMRDFDGQSTNYGTGSNFVPYSGEYHGVTRYSGTNKSEKLKKLFGTDEMSESLVKQYMVTIKVPGWDRALEKEVELDLTIHKDVADDVLNCVTKLKESGFKIYSIGGYSYRVVKTPKKKSDGSGYADDPSGKLSNHSFGVAIDINPGVNPFIYNSNVDPNATDTETKMRTNNSPVVKAFKEIGWGWGGNYSSYKDYMHFSAFDKIPKDTA